MFCFLLSFWWRGDQKTLEAHNFTTTTNQQNMLKWLIPRGRTVTLFHQMVTIVLSRQNQGCSKNILIQSLQMTWHIHGLNSSEILCYHIISYKTIQTKHHQYSSMVYYTATSSCINQWISSSHLGRTYHRRILKWIHKCLATWAFMRFINPKCSTYREYLPTCGLECGHVPSH